MTDADVGLDPLLLALKQVRIELDERRVLEKELLAKIWDKAGDRLSRKVGTYQAKFVRSHRATLNEEGFRKAIPASVWHRLTREVLDPTKVEAALASGDLDPVVVKEHTTTSVVKQIRFYEVKASEAEEGEISVG